MRWTHGTVALTALAASVISFLAGRWSALPRRDDCPELGGVDPALGKLDDQALEKRLRAGPILPPSALERQIAGIRAQGEGADPARRACVLRAALAKAVASQEQARKTTPSLWGLDHPSDELRRTFLTEKLTRGWSEAERLDVLAQIEDTPISRLAGASPADLEHWRRRYYGILVTCEITDEGLMKLGAARPADCPKLAPRRPAP
ncbi:MAG: hypothetical protein QM820_03995 [Minicystis sp.]